MSADCYTVLVCGGRRFANPQRLFMVLDSLHQKRPFCRLIHGGASGADAIAHRWGLDRLGIERVVMERPDWDRYPNSGGFRRNELMLEQHKPDLVVAFKGTAGTAHMVSIAEAAHVPVKRVDW